MYCNAAGGAGEALPEQRDAEKVNPPELDRQPDLDTVAKPIGDTDRFVFAFLVSSDGVRVSAIFVSGVSRFVNAGLRSNDLGCGNVLKSRRSRDES